MVFGIFMTIVVSIIEFSIFFSSYLSITFAGRDATQLTATLGNTVGADCAVLERVSQDINTPADSKQITKVEIFWVNTADSSGGAFPGATTTYTYDGGSHPCTKPDGTKPYVPFSPTPPAITGYIESTRCNVNKGVGCPATGIYAHGTVDTIGVRITYQYKWVTPFPAMLGGDSANGPQITITTQMRLEPVK